MTLEVSKPDDGILLLTLNRQERSNAIDPATDQAMCDAWKDADNDPSVSCIILTGAGDRAFCAGADIETYLPHMRALSERGADPSTFCGLTRRYPTSKPIVAAINGAALGGGLELALACDIRIAAAGARFGLPEVKLGVLAGGGGCSKLPRAISPALAAEMLLSGGSIDAIQALNFGLVSRVTGAGELMDNALSIAKAIGANAPKSIRYTLDILRQARSLSLEQSLDLERSYFTELVRSRDAAEGMNAFIERRTPQFEG